jgi:hypothetical protein
MNTFTFAIALLLVYSSCKERKAIIPIESDNSESTGTYFSQKPASYYYAYDASKSEIENFSNGYIGTFSVAGTNFQLLSNPDSLGALELQVIKSGNWQTNLKVPYGINGNQAKQDFNGDGFNDFVTSLLRGNQVYLFDTSKNEFYSEPVSFAFEWTEIDKGKNLFSNNYSSHDYYETDLFKLDGFRQTFLYTAPIQYTITDGTEMATLRLYKVRNNNLDDTIFVAERRLEILQSPFEYKIFWSDLIKQKANP